MAWPCSVAWEIITIADTLCMPGINGMFIEFGKEMGRKFLFLFGLEGKGKEKFVFLVWEGKGRKRQGKKLCFGSGGKWEG